MLRVAGTINFGNLTAYSVIAKKIWCFTEKVKTDARSTHEMSKQHLKY